MDCCRNGRGTFGRIGPHSRGDLRDFAGRWTKDGRWSLTLSSDLDRCEEERKRGSMSGRGRGSAGGKRSGSVCLCAK